MITPTAQQILGIEQDIHPLGQEQRDHVGITHFACIVLLTGAGFGQTRLVQRMHLFQKLGRTVDRSKRLVVEIGQALAQ